MGHEIFLKLHVEDIFFMTHESKSCLIFHENDGE